MASYVHKQNWMQSRENDMGAGEEYGLYFPGSHSRMKEADEKERT